MAIARIADRRLQQRRKGQAAEPAGQCDPPAKGAGHGHRLVPAIQLGRIDGGIEQAGRAPREGERMDRSRLAVEAGGKAIARRAGGPGFDDVHHRHGGDRRVGRAAALQQHPRPRHRGEGVPRRHAAMGHRHFHPMRSHGRRRAARRIGRARAGLRQRDDGQGDRCAGKSRRDQLATGKALILHQKLFLMLVYQ